MLLRALLMDITDGVGICMGFLSAGLVHSDQSFQVLFSKFGVCVTSYCIQDALEQVYK